MIKTTHRRVPAGLAPELKIAIEELKSRLQIDELSEKDRKRLRKELGIFSAEIESLSRQADPVRLRPSVFDPGNPSTIGFFVALALTAQQRASLAAIEDFYGSGIYAIYYKGRHPDYRAISGTETPIYVGQTVHNPSKGVVDGTPGTKLCARLSEHAKSVARAGNLSLTDFEYRALVVSLGWETAAENHLLGIFKPVWNKEIGLIFGIGKHGDSASTRANRRSPWDTMHPGRGWAADSPSHKRNQSMLSKLLKDHFSLNPPFKSFEEILRVFVEKLRQSAT
jgi:hypothetical protein